MKIAILGGGWNGADIALFLKKLGHDVCIFEKLPDIFSNISGNFGIRLHAGPHYPRSSKTRAGCHRGFKKFHEVYPDLIVEHKRSVYGLGIQDAEGKPSKVDPETFKSVCEETKDSNQLSLETSSYQNLILAMSVREPSIAIGARLRETFRQYLKNASVNVIFNFEVKKIEKYDGKTAIRVNEQLEFFDYIINATGYTSLLPDVSLPFNMEIVYQPCLALIYKDQKSTDCPTLPISFIVMDGMYPCLMPYGDPISEDGKFFRNYILTHGMYTIMGSFKTVTEANELLASLNDEFIENKVKPYCEKEIIKFWPKFEKRFAYSGWKGNILAKIKTNREFRSVVTFASDNMIYIIPGKVSNVFDAEEEVLSLINKKNIIVDGNFQYIKGGVLYDAE